MDSFGGVTIANCKYIISLVVLFFLARARHDDILHSCCKSLSLSLLSIPCFLESGDRMQPVPVSAYAGDSITQHAFHRFWFPGDRSLPMGIRFLTVFIMTLWPPCPCRRGRT
jgi:hypothetical protein